MGSLKNPGLPGDVPFDTVIYDSPGVNYSAVPPLAQYNISDSPDPAYLTGRINISAFGNLGSPEVCRLANVPRGGDTATLTITKPGPSHRLAAYIYAAARTLDLFTSTIGPDIKEASRLAG
jgi:hypothetical protein